MLRARSVIFILFVWFLAGCASFTSPARKHELEASKPYWIDYDAYRRGALFIPISTAQGRTIRTCAEPPPDVAMQLIDKFTARGGEGDINAEVSAEVAQNALQLAQRTQIIQFLREALFRLCEISLNMRLTPEEVTSMYAKVITSAKDMSEAEKASAERSATEAKIRLEAIKLKSSKELDKIKKDIKEGPQ